MALVQLVDFTRPRRGRVEDQLDSQVEHVGEANRQGVLDGFLVGFKPIHGPVEMLSGQRSGAVQAYSFASPLCVPGAFGPGRTSPVGHRAKRARSTATLP